jgi:hypothetical protein
MKGVKRWVIGTSKSNIREMRVANLGAIAGRERRDVAVRKTQPVQK